LDAVSSAGSSTVSFHSADEDVVAKQVEEVVGALAAVKLDEGEKREEVVA
jgi:hypothetical protein